MLLWKATEARSYSLEILIVCVGWYALLRATDALVARDDRAAGCGRRSREVVTANVTT